MDELAADLFWLVSGKQGDQFQKSFKKRSISFFLGKSWPSRMWAIGGLPVETVRSLHMGPKLQARVLAAYTSN